MTQLRVSIETPAAATAEDRRRIQGLVRAEALDDDHPEIDTDALHALRAKLEEGVETGVPPKSLGSSMGMRRLRSRVFKKLLTAFDRWSDDDLRVFTIIHPGWRFTPTELAAISAETIRNRLRADLVRTKVFETEGPFVAFLHGEYDPVSGICQLHFHGVTTSEKALALKRGLRKIAGYRKTVTGASGVRVQRVQDRVVQVTYLLKGFWPSKGVRLCADGKWRRDRKGGRIAEPFHSQVLIWLDSHHPHDLTLMNDVWSRRKGGNAVMRDFYLSVMLGL